MMRNRKSRLEELTIEVENFLKFNGNKRDCGSYEVDKRMFIDTLIDSYSYESTYDDKPFINTKYNFLNKRINTAFHKTYRKLYEKVDYNTLFSIACEMIIEFVNKLDNDYIEIYFDNYYGKADDIKSIVYMIDYNLLHKTLQEEMQYNYKRKEVRDKGDSKYESKYGNVLQLDEFDEEMEVSVGEVISDEDVISHYQSDNEDDLKVALIMEEKKLTKNQKKVLEVYMSNFNYNQTAQILDKDRSNIRKTMNTIREKFGITERSKVECDELIVLREIIDYNDSLIYFIKKYNTMGLFHRMILNTDKVGQVEYRKYINGRKYDEELLNRFLEQIRNNFSEMFEK